MAIEDQPRYPEWSRAFDKYVEQSEFYLRLVRDRQPEHLVRSARLLMQRAQIDYFAISDELNYA